MGPARLALGIVVSMASCGVYCGTSLAFPARLAASLVDSPPCHLACGGTATGSWPDRRLLPLHAAAAVAAALLQRTHASVVAIGSVTAADW